VAPFPGQLETTVGLATTPAAVVVVVAAAVAVVLVALRDIIRLTPPLPPAPDTYCGVVVEADTETVEDEAVGRDGTLALSLILPPTLLPPPLPLPPLILVPPAPLLAVAVATASSGNVEE
jgi:hypothetical protein